MCFYLLSGLLPELTGDIAQPHLITVHSPWCEREGKTKRKREREEERERKREREKEREKKREKERKRERGRRFQKRR